MAVIGHWWIYVCPKCNTVYADPSNICECELPEGVTPEPVRVVPAASRQRGAVEALREIATETREPFVGEAQRQPTVAARKAQAALDRLGGQ